MKAGKRLDPQTVLHSFKLDRSGLARVFGELEAAVMEAVWELGAPTVAEVCEALGPDTNYKTVMTVLNRLVDKGTLTRKLDARAYRYEAVESRAAFEARVSRQVVEGLLLEFGDMAVAEFVNALDAVDPDLLERLRALVRARADGTVGAEDGHAGDEQ